MHCTLNPRQIKNLRATTASWLRERCLLKYGAIAAVMRCRAPDEARSLVARGRRLLRAFESDMSRADVILKGRHD